MTVQNLTVQGTTYPVDAHELDGGTFGSQGSAFLSAVASATAASTATVATTTVAATTSISSSGLTITPVTPVTVANGATVALSATVSTNVLRPTSDTTIAGAVINLPTSPVDGQRVTVTTTGAITTVTGTISSAPLPVTSTLAAGASVTYVYNTAATKWFKA